MQLSERIFVKENEPMAELCQRQTPLWNQTMFYLRQEHHYLADDFKEITTKAGTTKQVAAGFLTYYDLNDKTMLKWKDCFRKAIPACASNTIERACNAWKGYWESLKLWNTQGFGSGMTGPPRMPGYKGENNCAGCKAREPCTLDPSKHVKSPVYFTWGQFSIKDHWLVINPAQFTKADLDPVATIHVPRLANQKTVQGKIVSESTTPVQQIRIIPTRSGSGYWLECVHDANYTPANVDGNNIAAIDLNLNRVVMMVFSDTVTENKPIGWSGGPIKSINQFWNKDIARLQREQARHDPRLAELQRKCDAWGKLDTDQRKENPGLNMTPAEWTEWKQRARRTKLMNALTENRNNRVKAFFHRLSRAVVTIAVERGIGTIVIGHNKLQKQHIDLGDRTNQNFVQIPVFKFIGMLRYKCELSGIELVEIPEDYTTQSSFYDNDPVPTLEEMKTNPVTFSGARVNNNHRYKIYKTSGGKIMHGDVNDAYNILRKVFPNAVTSNGIEDARLHPEIRVVPAS